MTSTARRTSAPIMSDAEGDDVPQVAAAAGPMDIQTALQEVLKTALVQDNLARGLRETCRALDTRHAQLCVLANNCDEALYVKLIEALCSEHGIDLIKVEDNIKLGEWAGLCKIDKDGNPRKIVRCSSVAVKEMDKDSQAYDVLMEYLKNKKAA